jgi:hypothetical protein
MLTSKQISFTGKHNIDKINNIDSKNEAKRLHMEDLLDTDITHKAQVEMCNKLYMDCDFELKSLLEKELNKKIQGYKAQDIKKEFYDSSLLINLNDTLEKLISTKLHCYYCKREVLLLYKNVREPSQWTLDRIDNSKCHSKENTVIACLKCNLQRRVIDMDKFTFTKHLVIKKS